MTSVGQFRLELACVVSGLPYRRSFFRRGGFRLLGKDLEEWPSLLEHFFGSEWIERGRQAFRELRENRAFQKQLSRISVQFCNEEDYPHQLRQIFDAPGVLWIAGPLAESGQERPLSPCWQIRQAVAVIGTRNPENISLIATEKFVQRWLGDALTVSGLARGIDAWAHRKSLEIGASTIAVLGAGILHPGPEENGHLWREQYPGSLFLVSEFLPDTRPRSFHFPRRNRIIAGLSQCIALMQAPEGSGALISAEFALEEGRDLLVFDHSLLQKAGCNEGARKLLQQGAIDMQQSLNLIPEEALYSAPDGPVDPASEMWLQDKLQEGRLRPLGQGLLFLDS